MLLFGLHTVPYCTLIFGAITFNGIVQFDMVILVDFACVFLKTTVAFCRKTHGRVIRLFKTGSKHVTGYTRTQNPFAFASGMLGSQTESRLLDPFPSQRGRPLWPGVMGTALCYHLAITRILLLPYPRLPRRFHICIFLVFQFLLPTNGPNF